MAYSLLSNQNYLLRREIFNSVFKKRHSSYLRNLDVHIAAGCNLACKMCYKNFWKISPFFMPWKFYRDEVLIPAQTLGLRSVNIIADGEPLLHPHIDRIIVETKKRGLRLELYTNLLCSKKLFQFVASRVDKICFNITGIELNSFFASQQIKRKDCEDKFNIIIRNLDNIDNQTSFKLIFVLTRFSYKDLDSIVELCLSKDIDLEIRLPVQIDNSLEGILFSWHDIVSLKRNALSLYHKLLKINKYEFAYEVKKIITSVVRQDKNSSKYRLHYNYQIRRCIYPWGVCFVDYLGRVFVCSVRRDFMVADLSKESLKDIWKGDKYYFYRRKLLFEFDRRKKEFLQCKNCINMGSGEFYLDRYAFGRIKKL